jgi:hypothetical protein
MKTSGLDQEIRSRIDAFLADITTLLKQAALESVKDALGDGAVKRGPGRPRKVAASRGRRGRRDPAAIAALADKILSHVRAIPGQRLEEIGRSLGMDTAVLKRPIANLLATRALRTEGRKRGTMYFPGGKRRKAKAGHRRKSARRTSAKRGAGRRKKATKRKATKRTARRPSPTKAAPAAAVATPSAA